MAGPSVVGEEDDGSGEGGYVEGTLDAVEQAPVEVKCLSDVSYEATVALELVPQCSLFERSSDAE